MTLMTSIDIDSIVVGIVQASDIVDIPSDLFDLHLFIIQW